MKYHPLSEFFPMLPEKEFVELKASIKEIGQREPIVLYEGMILDGRNRYIACEELGIEPKIIEHKNQVPAIAVVVACNLRRRHLTGPQRVAILRKIYPPTSHGKRGDGKKSSCTDDSFSEPGTTKTLEEVAELAGTGTSAVSYFDRLKVSDPDLADEVERGETSLHKAGIEKKRREDKGTWRYGKEIPPILDILGGVERWAKSLKTKTLGTGKPLHHDAAQYIGNKVEGIIEILQELRDELKGMERNG